MNFYICEHCGNITAKLADSGVPLICCGRRMAAMEAGSRETAVEKHIPKVSHTGDRLHIEVGNTPHPMDEAHFIRWIVLETTDGFRCHPLLIHQKPEADMILVCGERPLAVYAVCNLHGLWKAEMSL